jgi:hypothetical protein
MKTGIADIVYKPVGIAQSALEDGAGLSKTNVST